MVGSKVKIWEQEPTAEPIDIRTAYLHTPVERGSWSVTRVSSTLVIVFALLTLGGCNGTTPSADPCAVKVGWLNRPAAATPLVWKAPNNTANFSWNWEFEDHGTYSNIFSSETTGLAFTMYLNLLYPTAGSVFDDDGDSVAIGYMLEFQFPPHDCPNPMRLEWSMRPTLGSSFVLTPYVRTGRIIYEWVIYEDPSGGYSLTTTPSATLINLLKPHIESTNQYSYIYPSSMDSRPPLSDLRSGEFVVLPGMTGKLFAGVSVSLQASEEGDNVITGMDRQDFQIGTSSASGGSDIFGPEYVIGPIP